VALFLHLLTAEVGGNAMAAWQAYLDKWDETNQKYAKQEAPEDDYEIPESDTEQTDDEFDEQFIESEEEKRLRKYSENKEREEKAKPGVKNGDSTGVPSRG
jgi:hypothetical protein